MFWRFAFQANAVSFESLLDKLDQAEEDSRVTSDDQSSDSEDGSHPWDNELEAVLKDAELLQELKKGNDRLLHWLCKTDVIIKMFNWVFENGSITSSKNQEARKSESKEKNTLDNLSSEGGESNEPEKENQELSQIALDDDEIVSGGVGAFVENSAKADEEAILSKKKLALVSLEILSFENPILQDTILRYPENALQRLWDILYLPEETSIPTHLSLAFGRIFTSLIARRTRQSLAFLYEQKDTVKAILSHLNDSMILDILLKLLCLEEISDGQGVADWLHSQGLITLLVDRLEPKFGYDMHSNVSQVLLHILAISQAPPSNANQGPNIQSNAGIDPITGQPLTIRCYSLVKELTSEPTLNRIVGYMLDSELPLDLLKEDPYLPSSQLISSLTFGVTIFIEIIRRHFLDTDNEHHGQSTPRGSRSPSPTPTPSPSVTPSPPLVDLGILISILTRRLPDFVRLLKEPRSIKQPMSNTSGDFTPLGFERLKVCELIAELLHGSNMKALNITSAPLNSEEISRLIEKRDIFVDKSSIPIFSDPVARLAVKSISSNAKAGDLATDKFDQFGLAEADDFNTTLVASNPTTLEASSLPEAQEKSTEDNEEQLAGKLSNLTIKDTETPSISIGEWAKLSILDNDILTVFLDLFQAYPWNNFVHVVVFDIIHQVLNLPTDNITNLSLISSLFIKAKITERILSIQQLNDSPTLNPNKVRLGYMGYLTFIAEETVKLLDRAGYELDARVQEYARSSAWQEYVYQSLRDTKQRDMEPLDGNMGSYSTGHAIGMVSSIDMISSEDKVANNSESSSNIGTSQNNVQEQEVANEQHNRPSSDHYNSIEATSFSNSQWGVDEDEDDDDDDDDDDELDLPHPIPTHFSSPPTI